MKLHWSPRSPFVRKVMITLHETGLTDAVELCRSVVAIHQPPDARILADNPLGKIPTLVTDDGPLADSRVICEYLDGLAGTQLFPDGPARFQHLRWQAMADGLTDLLLLWRTECLRAQGPWDAIVVGWRAKAQATMEMFEHEADQLRQMPFGIGHIAVICALGQLDFRWNDSNWRDHFPKLAACAAEWAQRPSVKATAIRDDDQNAADEVTLGQLRFSSAYGQKSR
jgi:glutathione S-transferase